MPTHSHTQAQGGDTTHSFTAKHKKQTGNEKARGERRKRRKIPCDQDQEEGKRLLETFESQKDRITSVVENLQLQFLVFV